MKRTLSEKIAAGIHKMYFDIIHPEYVKTYARRFAKDFCQKDLEFCVSMFYEYSMKKKLNLTNPQTFNEKLNWLKCFYHNDSMTECADKVSAPAYFKKHTGLSDKYIVKNLGIYDSPEEINFELLPNEFVLKSNWGSGKQIIVRDKSRLNINQIKGEMSTWNDVKSNQYYLGFEYCYKNIVPKIVCEEFLTFDYKIEFFCFNGNPVYFWTIFDDKTDNVCADFYDAVALKKINMRHGYPNSKITIDIPKEYNEMFDIACNLSKGFPFVRIDFFKTPESFKFSEMTFYHWCGIVPFSPTSMDVEFGKHIVLPEKII